MQSSLERIDPDQLVADETTGDITLQLHLERYHFAGRHLTKGNCADIACGTGYGSSLLINHYSEKIDRVVAADLDRSAIEIAQARYAHPKIEFIVGDALTFKSSFSLHNIISLETIEHLPDPSSFVRNMSKQLETGGRFISSVPITPSMDANPYHLHDFSRSAFVKLFTDNNLRMIGSFVQVQPYKLFAVLNKKEERSKDLRKGMLGYYLQHPSKFLLRIKSVLGDGFNNKYLVAAFEKL